MACPRRRCDGTGYQKPTDAALAATNEKALAALMAARSQQDRALYGAWTTAVVDCSSEPLSPASSTPGADVVEVDGHYYRFDNPGNAEKIQKDLEKLVADRGYQNAGAATSLILSVAAAVDEDDRITHVGGAPPLTWLSGQK